MAIRKVTVTTYFETGQEEAMEESLKKWFEAEEVPHTEMDLEFSDPTPKELEQVEKGSPFYYRRWTMG